MEFVTVIVVLTVVTDWYSVNYPMKVTEEEEDKRTFVVRVTIIKSRNRHTIVSPTLFSRVHPFKAGYCTCVTINAFLTAWK